MSGLTFKTSSGSSTTLDPSVAKDLAKQVKGEILTSESPGYDKVRTIWNAMIDRRPALIARCKTTDDVVQCVKFATQHGLLVAVRGGGHNIAGNAVCDGGLLIDLSLMRAVTVDAAKQTARVEGGALLGDLDAATQAHGLATPLGINSTTGVAGLTLGGGFGWLSRRYGMTIDNLSGATIVTADGASHIVSSDAEPDLFWALRGGGGNFGVVTSFEFLLHPVGPEVHAGLVVYPFTQARQVLRAWRDFSVAAPEALSVWSVLRKAPPLPFLPASVHGQEVVVFALVHSGDLATGARDAAPVLGFGDVVGSAVGPSPYAGFQTAFDPLLTAGARNYWKSNNFSALSDAALDVVIDAAAQLPGSECEIFIAQLGGAMARVKPSATAFAGRDARYIMNVHGRWSDPRDDERVRTWARRVFSAAAAHGTGGGYVNFLTDDEGERVAAAYGENYPRLQAVKKRYDPSNLFRVNLNIAPEGDWTARASP
jgi:FAD/FMN-containing dehydrogenase